MPSRQPDTAELLEFSDRIAREAAKEIVPRFARPELEVERKQDATPVTAADRDSETRLRELIRENYPAHGIVGEEFGEENADAEYVWVLDPIDGTKSFISGVPLFATLIAVMRDGQPIAGCIHQPVLDQMVLGDGERTTLDGAVVRGRRTENLADATLVTTDPIRQTLYRPGSHWDKLTASVGLYRSWGDAYGYLLVSAGFVDIMVDPALDLWDIAAHLPILRGAGLKATGWHGGDALEERSIVTAHPELHAKAMAVLHAER